MQADFDCELGAALRVDARRALESLAALHERAPGARVDPRAVARLFRRRAGSVFLSRAHSAALRWAAARSLGVVKFLVVALRPAPADVRRAGAVAAACDYGQAEAAEWLASRFGLDEAAARGALVEACAAGDLAVARVLAGRVAPAAGSEPAMGALWAACAGGHLEVAQWLTARFGLSRADADPGALRAALAHCGEIGAPELARFLGAAFAPMANLASSTVSPAEGGPPQPSRR